MQGKKNYTEKLFVNFQLSEHVSKNNFYRRLKEVLDLNFLYKQTKKYYGDCGQKSIDPIVFFKLCLVGYLENLISDRKLIEHNKASKEEQSIQASPSTLKSIVTRQKKWSKDQDKRVGAGNKGCKYTSNKTHYSPTDPDAKISVKPGKARKLNYMSQLSVDTANHVITDIQAYHAHKKDSQYLADITKRLKIRLHTQGFLWHNLVADTGYSSGENYAFLEEIGITSYIPPHGTYKGGPAGFTYNKKENYWLCQNDKKVKFIKEKTERGTLKHLYLTKRKDCVDCPFKTTCIGKQHEKKVVITAYREHYE